MRSAESVEQLRAELRQDLAFIRRSHEKNRQMTARVDAAAQRDEFDYAALGYTLHNLYNAFESYFLRVAKFFENNLDDPAWHRSLLERMTLDIEDVRPALLDRQLADRLDELLRFRHLFRNLYKTPLIPEKVDFTNRYAEGIVDLFVPYHERFDRFLLELKERIEG